MRRLRRAGRPPRRHDGTRGTRWTAINACLVPAAGFDSQEVITSEGLGDPDADAPGAAADGGPRRVAVRLLHTGFHLLDGRRVLSGRPHAERRRRSSDRKRAGHPERPEPDGAPTLMSIQPRRVRPPITNTGRTVSTCTRCPGTCAAAPGTGRSGTPPTHSAARGSPTRWRSAGPQPAPAPAPTVITARRDRVPAAGRPGPGAATCWPSTRTPDWSPDPPTGGSS